MVQKEIGTEAFRQARPLAEGQKSADGKHDWGIATPLRQQRQLAEGVGFPEKNADFRVFETSFGGGGQISREKCRFSCFRAVIWRRGSSVRKRHPIVAILDHASPAKGRG
jgi:hypothetical protein